MSSAASVNACWRRKSGRSTTVADVREWRPAREDQAIRQVPEHTTAAQPAAFEGHPVDAEVSVPMTGFIQADGLFVGF